MTSRAVGMTDKPVTTLRGATVEVDARHARTVLMAICLLALAASTIVLFISGMDKNAQINRLRQQGVPLEVTVSTCLGLMGGSGSNLAGYDCTASFTLNGHRYSDSLPGNALVTPGTRLRAVVVPSDPALLSTPRAMATQHSSWRVFILPSVLVVALGLLLVVAFLKRADLRAAPSRIP
ncbi:MAG: hypothetical protein ABSD97_14300 [Acidimicrobiales bacterium]